MEKKMNQTEALKRVIEENQTRKILDIIEKAENLEDAVKKVRALLKN